jgi:hypothetical protein
MTPGLLTFRPMLSFSQTFNHKKNFKTEAFRTTLSHLKVLSKKKSRASINCSKALLLKKVYVYSSCLDSQSQKKVLKSLNTSLRVTKTLTKADAIIVSKLFLQRNPSLQKLATTTKIPIYLIKKDSLHQFKLVSKHIQNVYSKNTSELLSVNLEVTNDCG